MQYNKPFKTIKEQIELLKERGLIIEDEEYASFFLEHINYYHLSAYTKTFQNKSDNFTDGTKFEDVINIYKFDRKLRLLFLGLLEKIEISFKSILSYELTKDKDDIYWYSKKENYTKEDVIDKFVDNLKESNEKFIIKFYEKYTDSDYPPAWMFFESLSFGECRFLANSLHDNDKQIISAAYKLSKKTTLQMFYYMASLRNICAHHSWLWNKRFSSKIGKIKGYESLFTEDRNQLFDYLLVLQILLSIITPESIWIEKLKDLIEEYGIATYRMGFPDDWKEKLESI